MYADIFWYKPYGVKEVKILIISSEFQLVNNNWSQPFVGVYLIYKNVK